MYAALTVLAALAAITVVWLYRSVASSRRSNRENARRNQQRAKRLAHLNSNLATSPAPWGWGENPGTASTPRFAGGHGHTPRVDKPMRKSQDLRGTKLHKTDLQLRISGARDKSQVLSSRNVLSGYDLNRGTLSNENTSNWPYRDDSFGSSLTSVPSFKGASREGDRPRKKHRQVGKSDTKKPWGW